MSSQTNSLEQAIRNQVAELWWMPLIRGILLILFGILMYISPGTTLLSLIYYLGFLWIFDGVLNFFQGFRFNADFRTWLIIGGIFSVIAGILVVAQPVVAGLVGGSFLVFLIGFATLVSGVAMTFTGRNGHWTFWWMLVGILYILMGLAIILNPMISLASLIWMIPILAIASGIFSLIAAFQIRSLNR